MAIPKFHSPEDIPEHFPEHFPEGVLDAYLRRRFINETHTFLNYIVVGVNEDRWQELRYDRFPRWQGLPHDQFPFLHQAWEDTVGQFRRLEQSVINIGPGEVARHGLGGAQLKFKLANVARWSERLGDGDLPTPDDATMARLPAKWRKYIRHLLNSINNLLKSILDAVGAGSALQEIKDAIKDALAWLFDD